MTLKNLQDEVDKWVNQYTIGYWKPHEIITRLTEEVGELAREINHVHGPKRKKSTEEDNEIGDEISDIMFTLFCLANSHNINLDESFKKTMKKCYERDKDRFAKSESALQERK